MIIIKNVNIIGFTNEDDYISDIAIENGIIKKIGKNINIDGYKIIDAKGYNALPGLIDPHSHIGIYEQDMGYEGEDVNELTDPITPHMMAYDGVNPQDPSFAQALMEGVTTVVTGPGSGNVIGGQFAALKTYGDSIDEMMIKPSVAMKVAFGENPKTVYGKNDKAPMTRMANAAMLKEALLKAKIYATKDKPEFDIKNQELAKVIKKQLPLKAHAHRADDILTALRIAKEFDIDITIEHCTEGHLIFKQLKKYNAKVILGPLMIGRTKIEIKNMSLESPMKYEKEGIEFALMTDHPVVPEYLLRTSAALLVANGLSEKVALKSITINAAKLTGLDDIIGSITEGKQADIILFKGDFFDIRNKIDFVMINGDIVKNNLNKC